MKQLINDPIEQDNLIVNYITSQIAADTKQIHLTLEKMFSRELVNDFLALFFRMSSLNLPPLDAFSRIVLLEEF